MKKLLAILILSISLIGIGNAQDTFQINTSLFWADSLWDGIHIDTVGVDDTTAANTTSELRLNYQYDWMNIVAVDTGVTYDDSVLVEYAVYPLASNAVSDTIWTIVQFMRDSSWTNVNMMLNDNAITSYKVFVGDYDLIRVRIVNVNAVENRIFKFYATLSRKR